MKAVNSAANVYDRQASGSIPESMRAHSAAGSYILQGYLREATCLAACRPRGLGKPQSTVGQPDVTAEENEGFWG